MVEGVVFTLIPLKPPKLRNSLPQAFAILYVMYVKYNIHYIQNHTP